jgi:hypothetical protein
MGQLGDLISPLDICFVSKSAHAFTIPASARLVMAFGTGAGFVPGHMAFAASRALILSSLICCPSPF